jgi:Family of unknown function (DUF6580)
MEQKRTSFQPLALTLTVLAALVRLLPHPSNFTPVGSAALFGGARLCGWQAYVVPILAMLVTDPIRSRLEGGYAPYSWTTLVIYAAFLINVVLGRVFLRNSSRVGRIVAVALAGSIQFYLITNFYVWWRGFSPYSHNFAGLLTCYIAALPFFGRTVLGDLFYSGILFSADALLRRRHSETLDRPAAA